MRKCFRYAQDKVKEQFRDYLLKRNEENKAKAQAKKEKKMT